LGLLDGQAGGSNGCPCLEPFESSYCEYVNTARATPERPLSSALKLYSPAFIASNPESLAEPFSQ